MHGDYKTVTLEGFKGVYAGQSALPCKSEQLHYLTNETLENCKVEIVGDKNEKEIYFLDEFEGLDPYDVFLGGPQGIIVIENPANTSGKELFIFRDSFGSSLTPLLVESYSKVTVLDLRNFRTELLASGFIEFTEGSDVLVILSSLALNEDNSFDASIINAK